MDNKNQNMSVQTTAKADKNGRYDSNPFYADMIIPIKGKSIRVGGLDIVSKTLGRDNEVSVVDKNTGEDMGTAVSVFRKVDSQNFMKIFTHNIGHIFSLPTSGIKALTILIWRAQAYIKKDEILIDKYVIDEFFKYHPNHSRVGFSEPNIHKGMRELCEANIIAKTKRKGWYYLNPDFMFNGDRVDFVETLVLDRGDSPKQEQVEGQPIAPDVGRFGDARGFHDGETGKTTGVAFEDESFEEESIKDKQAKYREDMMKGLGQGLDDIV